MGLFKKSADDKPAMSPNNLLMLRFLGAGYVLYLLFDIVKSYFAGGEDAPKLYLVLIAVVILGGGSAWVLYTAWKEYKANKQAMEERLAQEQALAEQEEFEDDYEDASVNEQAQQ